MGAAPHLPAPYVCLRSACANLPAPAAAACALTHPTNSKGAQLLRALQLQASGRLDEARAGYKEVLALAPAYVPAMLLRAALLAAGLEWAAAIRTYDAVFANGGGFRALLESANKAIKAAGFNGGHARAAEDSVPADPGALNSLKPGGGIQGDAAAALTTAWWKRELSPDLSAEVPRTRIH